VVVVDTTIVTVLESQNPVEIAWAKAALEEAGIDYYVAGEQVGVLAEAISPFIVAVCRVQVASDRVAEARAILEPMTHMERGGRRIE